MPHRLPGPPREAVLLERENRFLARCRLDTGEEVAAHVPDRGRLEKLLIPGTRVLLYAAPAGLRRSAWSLLVAEDPAARVLVAIDPAAANARARALIDSGRLAGLGGGWSVRPEVTVGASRFDFLLTRGDERLLLEVKSVGVVRDGVAMFPDAPTVRGARHLGELGAWVEGGHGGAAVLFVAQREDALAVRADAEIDPVFAAALEALPARVVRLAACFAIEARGARFVGAIPVLGREPQCTQAPETAGDSVPRR